MAKMSLKELCQELNSPYASYRKNVGYKTAFPYGLPFSCHFVPNQSVAESLSIIAPEILEIKHGKELVQVTYLKDLEARLAYSGETAAMNETIRLLKLPPFAKNSRSLGDSP